MMIHAYDESYLECAQRSLGSLLEYGVYSLHMTLEQIFSAFLNSRWSHYFERGDAHTLAGMSGIELAWNVLVEQNICSEEDCHAAPPPAFRDYSPEYWTGWALAYYQWSTGRSFSEIESVQPIREIRLLYTPYHEMDIQQFHDRMQEWYRRLSPDSRLKQIRTGRGFSQSQLALLSGIPVRTIQQYEQRQKDINRAQAASVVQLARALGCSVMDLLE